MAIQVAGDNGQNGLAAQQLASVVKNREDELTSAQTRLTSSKFRAVTLAIGWPGLPGPDAPEHVLAANDLDPDSIPAALRLFSVIQASLLLEKSRPKLAEMSVLTVFGLAGPVVQLLAAVE